MISLTPYRKYIAVILILSVLSNIIEVSAAYFIQNIVDLTLKKNAYELKMCIILMISVMLMGVLVTFFLKYIYGLFGAIILRDLRKSSYQHTASLSIHDRDRQCSGDVLTTLTTDLTTVQSFIANDLINIFLQLGTFVIASFFMLLVNAKLFAISIFMSPIALAIVYILNKPVKNITKQSQASIGKSIAIILDLIRGISDIKVYNIGNKLYIKYQSLVKESLDMNLKNTKISIWIEPLNIVLRFIPSILCVTYGGYLVINQQLTPGDLLAFIFLLGFVSWPLAFLPSLYNHIKKFLAATERLKALYNLETERLTGKSYSHYQGNKMLRLNQVSFSYDSEIAAVHNISFELTTGKKIALVGASGSGKSTIFKLLSGFYDLKEGSIEIYEQSLEQWNLTEMRKNISVVSQDTYLFPATIFENILYGNVKATKEEVIAAAKAANAHEFIIEMPEGYNTIISENGLTLSGGQRQRIAIARAFLKKAPILLLDEPTSALDMHSESVIHTALEELMKEKSVIIIAHRLSTIKNVDEILVMDKGTIVDKGTHQNLIEKCNIYQQLCMKEYA